LSQTIEITFTDEEWEALEMMRKKHKIKTVDNTIKKAIEYYRLMKFTSGHDLEEFYKE
jgi:hypothetical protein